MQGTEDTLTDAVKSGFFASERGVKHVFFRFIETSITDMVHGELGPELT